MSSGFRDDNYLSCSDYRGHAVNANGFSLFQFSNGQYYFAWVENDGNVVLRSEGYSTETGRENGINSVLENMNDDVHYSTRQLQDGRWVLSLKAMNNHEIARSCPCKTEDEAKAIFPSERARRKSELGSLLKERQDDYLICKEYHEQITNFSDKYPGFISFTHDNGNHYFAMVEGDRILLRSEGYASESARDNGIESVIRNRDIEERYSIDSGHGIYFTVLKAGNNQEIARSCPQKSNDEAMSIFPSKRSAILAAASAAAAPIISKLTSESAGKKIITDSPRSEPLAERVKEVETPIISNVSYEEKLTPSIPILPPVAVPLKKREVEDNYLHCKEYQGHPIVDKMNRVAFFRHASEYYFAIYNADGSVRLRSEGYESVETRDKELSIALRHFNNEKRYTIIRNGDMYIKILKDVDGKEVGRSCLEKDDVKLVSSSVPIAEVGTTPASAATAKLHKDKEDDYLECKHYMGHAISDKENKVAFFQHEGQYYFVIYYADGRVRLRSEGFENTSQRDSELKAALRHLDDKDQYEVVKKEDYILRILKDKTGREVGRSCLEKEYIAPVSPAVPASPVFQSSATAASSIKNSASTEAENRASNWWKWILLFILLAVFLILLTEC